MKFIKADNTLEDGTPFTEFQGRICEVLHEIMCGKSTHYSFQGVPKCAEIALKVGNGWTLLDALEEFANPKPRTVKAASVGDEGIAILPEILQPIATHPVKLNEDEWKVQP